MASFSTGSRKQVTKTSSPFAIRLLNITVLHFNASEDPGLGQKQISKKLPLKQLLNENL